MTLKIPSDLYFCPVCQKVTTHTQVGTPTHRFFVCILCRVVTAEPNRLALAP